MKKRLAAAMGMVLALGSSAQVKITAFNPQGWLAWTNLAGASLPALYRIDWSLSPAGPWHPLTNTSQTSISFTNSLPTAAAPAFYRVMWTNGEVWSYEGYDSQSLSVTGRLYLSVAHLENCIIDGGAWNLTPTTRGGYYRTGSGALWPLYDQGLDCGHLIDFSPDATDNYYWVDVLNRGTNTWTGAWYWSGPATSAQGTFIARKISP